MALAKQRDMWARVGVMVAWIVNTSGRTQKPIRPVDVIPKSLRYPEPPRPRRTPEQLAEESKYAWKALRGYFAEQARSMRPRTTKRKGDKCQD
jgi:hypothetical protein